jgi:hypothetical protein
VGALGKHVMKVVIQKVIKSGDEPKYQIKMLIDGVEHVGSLNRDNKSKVWIFDEDFYKGLKASLGAPRRVSSIISQIHKGREFTFPIDLGDL